MSVELSTEVGFTVDEILTSQPTRAARLKWIVVVNDTLSRGLAANAAVCVAAATAVPVAGLLGPAGADAAGSIHPGLPWIGCTILAGSPEQLAELRERTTPMDDVYVADMPEAAQATRVYDEYLNELANSTAAISYSAISVIGPKNRIDKLGKRFPLWE